MFTILQPLAAPITVAAAGAMASYFTLGKWSPDVRRSRIVLALVMAVALLAAFIPNAGQTLYHLGMPFPTIEAVQLASYFVFAYAMFGAWKLLRNKWHRALLAVLVPVSFAQPLLWTWAYFSWTVWGFAS